MVDLTLTLTLTLTLLTLFLSTVWYSNCLGPETFRISFPLICKFKGNLQKHAMDHQSPKKESSAKKEPKKTKKENSHRDIVYI